MVELFAVFVILLWTFIHPDICVNGYIYFKVLTSTT